MANSYYERINKYLPRTRAVGEQVKEDYDGIEAGFDKLPTPNGSGTGFTVSFIVENPVQSQNPVPYHQWKLWKEDVNGGGFHLMNIGLAQSDGDAASLLMVKTHVYSWQQQVDAQQQALINLKDPVDLQDAVNRQYLVAYVNEHIRPDVPNGGISWSAPVAQGGETIIDPPFIFDLAAVCINGVVQEQTRGAFNISNNTIRLSQPLTVGDEVQVTLGRMTPPGNSEWTLITEDTDASSGQKFLLDSNSSSFTVTLPMGPIDNDRVDFLDVGGVLSTNFVTIARNGSLIMGSDEDLEIRTDHVSMALLFCGLTYGWRVLE